MTDLLYQVAAIATVLGFVSSSAAWLWERRNRRRLETENQRRIWSEISKVRGIMSDLEKDEGSGPYAVGRLQAVGKLTIMLRDLLREASLAEKSFDLDTIESWRAVGKLASDWQEQMALMLLPTDKINRHVADVLRPKYGSADELPIGHSMQAPVANVNATLPVTPKDPARPDETDDGRTES